MTFEPREHLMKLGKGEAAKDYLAVQWRLVWYRQECPEGTIETELISLDLDREISKEEGVWNNATRKFEKVMKSAKGYALFKATVKDGKGGCAVAHGSESAVDFGDFIEKSETKSVGRALAMLGYGTQFTGEELAEGARIVDSPVEHPSELPQNGQQKPQDAELVKLLGEVKKLALERGVADRPAWQVFVAEALKTYVPEDKLTKGQILTLRGEAMKRKKAS